MACFLFLLLLKSYFWIFLTGLKAKMNNCSKTFTIKFPPQKYTSKIIYCESLNQQQKDQGRNTGLQLLA